MQTRDNKRARLLPSGPSATLDTLDNDLIIRCASFLDADGLAQLGRMSKRFGIPQAGQQRSLANEAARQRFRQSATEDERKCLPKYVGESDIGLYRALESLRRPLRFDDLVGNGLSSQEHAARVTYKGYGGGWSTAMSMHAMRGGRHFVEFAITNRERHAPYTYLGVIRPVSLTELTNGIDLRGDWNGQVNPVGVPSSYQPAVAEKLRSQRTAKWGDSNIHCCAYHCGSGNCNWTSWDNDRVALEWQGREELAESGTIGLLLDLNEGTLSAFKNGRRLGVMKGGLGGEYCWFVTVTSPCMISISRGRAPN